MNYRIRSKISYFLKARHRKGHGIHSPFLFRLITNVVEENGFYSAYPKLAAAEEHVRSMVRILDKEFWQEPTALSKGKALPFYRPQHLLAPRFNRLFFRLVNDFSPQQITFFGNSFGVSLLALALADSRIPTNAIVPDYRYRAFCQRLVEEYEVSNVEVREIGNAIAADFLVLHYPEDPVRCEAILAEVVGRPDFKGVVVVCGIHTSRRMESVWHNYKQIQQVRIALDLFDIGLFICKSGLQKEEFVVRF